ncbi:MAG: glycoside hydrolase family 78 protein [Eubacterium sp.]|nr:glycoside hydrolase family 78 protein [Eubacterium sp.]
MQVTGIKINGIKNPVGFWMDYLSCSWKVEGTESKKQAYAKIEVSMDADFEELIYEKSGADLRQQGEKLEFDPMPRTVYYVRVTVTGDGGDCAVSEPAFFETGKMQEPWRAQWIAAYKEHTFHPVFRRHIRIEKPIKSARFYGTGVGMFELYVNGEKTGKEYLAPYLTNYEVKIQTMTYALDLLHEGDNTVELLLGKGWYMGLFGLDLQDCHYGSRMAAIAEIYLDYEDGTQEIVVTDESWEYRGSVIEDSGIYNGEIVNELLYEGKENPWRQAEVLQSPQNEPQTRCLDKSHLVDRLSLPVYAMEELAVKEVLHTPAGETVLDFGQNFAGFVEFEADFAKGTKIVLECAEILQDGNFYHGNYRDAESKFTYISDGGKKKVRPHFTFYGFRYIRVSGWQGECKKEAFTGKALYSDLERTGYVKTSNEKINRLYENTLWGLKSNFIDMPTDCPQRSERLGWTGDAQVFAPTASYHMDTAAFFHKFLSDLRDEQAYLDGGMPNFLPNFGHTEKAGSVWGDVATLVPDTMYRYYASLEEMERVYPMMRDWVEYIDRNDEANGGRNYLFDFADTFGDWLALDGMTPTSFKGSTDDSFISAVYYYRSVQIVRKMAVRLAKDEDAARYQALEQKIFDAVLHEFYSPGGRLSVDTQAAYVIALKSGIYRDREKLLGQFQNRLKKDMYQIRCGFVGAPLLCTVLGEAGMYETAYDFLLKETYPGWLFEVNMGATTIWERWNSVGEDGVISDTGMNSLNHYSYGSVMEYVYAYTAGIRPLEPGFAKAVIAPHPDIRLRKVECSYHSVSGKYVCNYEICTDGTFCVTIEIPFGASAVVELPGYEQERMELFAGVYTYAYKPKQDFRKPYSRRTTLRRLAQDPKALDVLRQYVPALAGIAASGDPEMGANTLEDLLHMPFLPFDPQKLEAGIAQLAELVV